MTEVDKLATGAPLSICRGDFFSAYHLSFYWKLMDMLYWSYDKWNRKWWGYSWVRSALRTVHLSHNTYMACCSGWSISKASRHICIHQRNDQDREQMTLHWYIIHNSVVFRRIFTPWVTVAYKYNRHGQKFSLLNFIRVLSNSQASQCFEKSLQKF